MSAAVTTRSSDAEQRRELVADGALEVAEDLGPVGIVLQARAARSR